jgi:hypothetical protein
MADDSSDEDEVIAEYPLYSSTTAALFKTETQDVRVVQLQYPLRPAWRQYDTENMSEVKYKPGHRFLAFKVPEDRPDHKVRFFVAPKQALLSLLMHMLIISPSLTSNQKSVIFTARCSQLQKPFQTALSSTRLVLLPHQ